METKTEASATPRVRVYSNLKFETGKSQMMNASSVGTFESTGKTHNVDGTEVKVFRIRKPNRNYYVLENEIPAGATKTEAPVAVKTAAVETTVIEAPAVTGEKSAVPTAEVKA